MAHLTTSLGLSLCVLTLVVQCGCDSRRGRAQHAEIRSVTLTFDAVKAMQRSDTTTAGAIIQEDGFDPALRTHVSFLLKQHEDSKASELLNQYIDLWVVARSADSRPHPFPSSDDGNETVVLLNNIAVFRKHNPREQRDSLVRETLQEVFDRAAQREGGSVDGSL